jgi:erythronate-4-phosphate dehydrogenase
MSDLHHRSSFLPTNQHLEMIMRIAVDANIPEAERFFSPWGEIIPFDGRHLKNEDLKSIDVLMVRSVTKVNQELLHETPIQFVGTATAGVNHIDSDWLHLQNIPWFSAPGSNSWSVADYITSLCAKLLKNQEIQPGAILGVIGHGHVGSKVAHRLSVLGFQVKIYDPLHPEINSHPEWNDLDNLADAELLTFHVPLTSIGSHPTLKMVNKEFLSRFAKPIRLINTCRGEVFHEADIMELKASGSITALYCDVYWNEPQVDLNYLQSCALFTPHIAGYSWTGKLRGTQMLADALTKVFGPRSNSLLTTGNPKSTIACHGLSLFDLLLQVYNPWEDQERWSEASDLRLDFDRQRKSYPQRLEYSDWNLLGIDPQMSSVLEQLGFKIEGSSSSHGSF